MNPRPLLYLTAIVVAVQLAVAGWALTQVDPTTQVPIHWDVSGRPDGFAEAWLALAFAPAITLVLGVLLAFIPRIDPRRVNLERSATAYRWITGSALVLLGGIQVLTAAAAVGASVSIPTFLGLAVGLLFVVIGNFLGKTRSSWFLGIRTPWTLSSERSWDRTHRLGGYLFILIGVVAAVSALLLPSEVAFWVLMAGVAVVFFTLVPYSYLVWRSDPDRRTL